MSENINDGGPAFPQPNHLVDTERGRECARHWMEDTGMSLRDWFAGQALGTFIQVNRDGAGSRLTPQLIALKCYLYADAMLKAREGKL